MEIIIHRRRGADQSDPAAFPIGEEVEGSQEAEGDV